LKSKKNYRSVVIDILNNIKPNAILDTPSGDGWLLNGLNFTVDIDGIDLFEKKPKGYGRFTNSDLDCGIPDSMANYDAVVSCEGIEHVGNPLLLLETIKKHLVDEGVLIITTPNTWFPGAKVQYFLRGFFPGFSCLVGKIARGTHMHITPWSFAHLYLFLKMSGFSEIRLHDVPEAKPKHFYEWFVGMPQWVYYKLKERSSSTREEKLFWSDAGSRQSIYGRRLVVSAKNKL